VICREKTGLLRDGKQQFLQKPPEVCWNCTPQQFLMREVRRNSCHQTKRHSKYMQKKNTPPTTPSPAIHPKKHLHPNPNIYEFPLLCKSIAMFIHAGM